MRKPAKQQTKQSMKAKQAPAKQAPTKQAPTKQAPTKQAPTKKAPTKKTRTKKPTRDPDQTLLAAVLDDDARRVVRAFAAGADPNSRSGGRAVVAWAIEKGNLAIVEAFIAAGLDLTLTVEDGWSLLMLARDERIARALLAAGADATYRSPEGERETVLTFAASIHPVEVVAVVLENGADPDRPRGDGCTPLIQAGPRLDVVKVLLDAGAIDVAGYQGKSALDIAIECRSDRIVALLEQHARRAVSRAR